MCVGRAGLQTPSRGINARSFWFLPPQAWFVKLQMTANGVTKQGRYYLEFEQNDGMELGLAREFQDLSAARCSAIPVSALCRPISIRMRSGESFYTQANRSQEIGISVALANKRVLTSNHQRFPDFQPLSERHDTFQLELYPEHDNHLESVVCPVKIPQQIHRFFFDPSPGATQFSPDHIPSASTRVSALSELCAGRKAR